MSWVTKSFVISHNLLTFIKVQCTQTEQYSWNFMSDLDMEHIVVFVK